MKKILRLFIPILCVLFALGSMPETVAALSGSFRGDSVLDSVLGSALDSVRNSFRFSSGSSEQLDGIRKCLCRSGSRSPYEGNSLCRRSGC